MTQVTSRWPKSISVDKRIVRILSESTYESFPSALREIIVNSYDADAETVRLTVDYPRREILIEDDGSGMSEEEFDHYLRIAGQRRTDRRKSGSGRSIVGQFGVGFLSVFPFFDEYQIETKKRDSEWLTGAVIPCREYFDVHRTINIDQIRISGGTKRVPSETLKGFTRIRLKGFTALTTAFFKVDVDRKIRRNSIQKMKPLDRIAWKLAEDLPLDYAEKQMSDLVKEYSPNLPFKVFVNGEPLIREIYGKDIIDRGKLSFGKLRGHYFIATSRKSVTPFEARGLKIRNLNVGIGERELFGIGAETGGARSHLHWLTGEVLISEGMNDHIQASRTGFHYDEDYERLKGFLEGRLRKMSGQLSREAELQTFKTERSKIKNLRLLKETRGKIADEVEKTLTVAGKTYTTKAANWNVAGNDFPACRVEGKTLLINSDYPLFQSTKYTDLFIKLHLLLLAGLKDGTLDSKRYKALNAQVLKFFADYIPEGRKG